MEIDRKVYDPESGEWVNETFQRVAEILSDFDPHLRLMWIPERQRTAFDLKPFALGWFTEGGTLEYIIMHLKEEEVNESLLAQVFQMRKNTEDLNGYLDSLEAAHNAMRYKEQLDRTAESAEFAASLVKTPLHTYRARGKVFNL